MGVPLNARDFTVRMAPPTVCYIPNFITHAEELHLLSRVYAAPKPKWQNLTNRRLQNWGGIVGKRSLIADNNIPDWLSKMIDRICEVNGTFATDKRPNHVLINEYLPGQGIMPHTDGGAYHPLVSTISLGSYTILDLYEHQGSPLLSSLFVEPRSLLLISEDAYKMLHGISERIDDDIAECRESILNKASLGDGDLVRKMDKGEGKLVRGTRVSLTIRNVPVVNKSLLAR